MPIYKKINKDFFKKWSHDMAYVLGFIFADGSIDINPRGSIYLAIQIADKELLYSIREVLESEHTIAARERRLPQEKTQYRLQIGGKDFCADIMKYGVNVQKAKTMKLPDVPKKYLGSFVRGYFDGDGNVYIRSRENRPHADLLVSFTSCSFSFLESLKKSLNSNEVLNGYIQQPEDNTYKLTFSQGGALKLYKIMYNGTEQNLFLERKKVVFEKYIALRP